MRKPLIAGNWKMNKTIEEAILLVSELGMLVDDVIDREVVVCPSFLALDAAIEAGVGSIISFGAQNMYWEEKGAFTGEISPKMLQDMGCSYVIIGHSERREYFGETDETVNKKLQAALGYELIPIVCVGEKLEDREKGITEDVIRKQVEAGLLGIDKEQAATLVVAYEPVWAIGTGKTASDKDAQKVVSFIRQLIADMYGKEAADRVRILYGGSIKPENIADLMRQPDIDGALVGGASLDAKVFASIVKYKD
ncbi:triose-phosphate isomerase [Phosphitispora sp. TUW77]|uniref:triose-phosphate isomerase n=1 Tax=Phosphitispora sp. TUW77 TaxID=3152361 RepID=UPI003AB5F50F